MLRAIPSQELDMAEKKMTAAQKKAAAEAEAAAAAEKKQTERTRLMWAGAVLAAVALFAGGYAVGTSNDDDPLVRGAFVEDDDRRGPFADDFCLIFYARTISISDQRFDLLHQVLQGCWIRRA